MLWLLSLVVCGVACIAMLRVVVNMLAMDCRLHGDSCVLLDFDLVAFDLVAYGL